MNKTTARSGFIAVAMCTAVIAAAISGTSRAATALPDPAPPPLLTATQIIERNVAARGGLNAWRKVQTMVWLGHMQSTHAAAPSMPFVLEQKRPNMTRFEIHVLNETTERRFNGLQGWKLHPDHGERPAVEPYSLQELRFAQSAPGIDGPLIDFAAKGYLPALEGLDVIEGHKVYRLSVRLPTGENDHVWIDAKTFLDVRYDRPSDGAIGAARSVSIYYSDYRNYDGLQLPSVIETGVGSNDTPDRMMIDRVVLNPPLDDDRFARPGVPHRHRPARPNAAAQAAPPKLALPTASASEPSAPSTSKQP